jgi:hypothetical protein
MASPSRFFRNAASETQKTFVIGICIIVMSAMAVGLVWQAEIIASQRQAIQWLEGSKFGG